jgi:hypothetical protein
MKECLDAMEPLHEGDHVKLCKGAISTLMQLGGVFIVSLAEDYTSCYEKLYRNRSRDNE